MMMDSHDDDVENISTTEGTFVVRAGAIQIFIENCGCAAEEAFMRLDASEKITATNSYLHSISMRYETFMHCQPNQLNLIDQLHRCFQL